jgi:hypothetical protein
MWSVIRNILAVIADFVVASVVMMTYLGARLAPRPTLAPVPTSG